MSKDAQGFDIAALEQEEALNGESPLTGIDSAIETIDELVKEEKCVEVEETDLETTTETDEKSPEDLEVDSDATEGKVAGEESTEGSDEEGGEEEEVLDPCVKCGVGMHPDYPMCRSCGYYERLNTFVEVDEDDADLIMGMANTGGFKMPTWAWVVLGIQGVLVLESLFVVTSFPATSAVRMVWSILQLTGGFIVAVTAHARATFLSVMEDAESDIGDFFMKPFRVWGVVVSQLPKSSIWLGMVISGVVAMLLSLLLIRSIPFNKLFETDAPPPKAPNLTKAIAEQAQKAEGSDMTMEEAMNEFAGEAVPGEEEDPELLRTHEQGVIVGYIAPDSNKDTISSVLVATAVKKKLQVLGTISAGLDDETKAKLAEDLRRVRRKTPFVETSLRAKWVHPVYLVEVSYKINKKEEKVDIRFERILQKTAVPSGKKKPAPTQPGIPGAKPRQNSK